MTLRIISAEDILFEGDVTSVHLPGVLGEFTVLRGHATLVSALQPGKIRYVKAEDHTEESVEIGGGVADVDHDVISVCIY